MTRTQVGLFLVCAGVGLLLGCSTDRSCVVAAPPPANPMHGYLDQPGIGPHDSLSDEIFLGEYQAPPGCEARRYRQFAHEEDRYERQYEWSDQLSREE